VQVVIPRQLDLARVRDLLDPMGRNISFGDHWADAARDQLIPRFALKVTSLPPADFRLVSACEKLRNAIVHRSAASVAEMNDALLVLDPAPDADLVRSSRVSAEGMAAYLHARAHPSYQRRVEAWHRRLREVAGKLAT
jgi:hypothetical protein